MRCCVPFCRTTAEIVSESADITFHAFPREVYLRDAWLRALGKQDTLLPAGAVVCSQHFLDDEIHETESGLRQIRTGAVPAAMLVCMICLETRNKLLPMSEHKLEQAYQRVVGNPPCGGDRLKRALCVQCAQRLVGFSTFRDETLRARRLLTELLRTHEVITRRHVALLSRYKHPLPSDIEPDRCDVDTALDATATVAADVATAIVAGDVAVAVKREVEHREHADTAACASIEDTPAATKADVETQAPIKREYTCEPESLEDHIQAPVTAVVLATNPVNEEYPTDSSDDWDIESFEKNANVLEDPGESLDTALKIIPKESLATISDSIYYRTTRRNDRFKNEQSKHSQGTQLGNHTDQILYICDVCQKIFQLKASLVSHIRAHAFAKKLSCQLRECKLSQNHTILSPETTHPAEPFACELCKYKCTAKSSLERHMRTHTGEKPFPCKLCKYKCALNSNLVRHMRTHTGEKPFACELCKYKCTAKDSLVGHMRTHTGEKPFACELCKYRSAQKCYLVTHMRTHTGEKPFACELCKYKCARKCSLVKHLRTHTGENPFACKLCQHKFRTKSQLVRHMKTHTGEKPFACELCKYKCARKCSLVEHLRTHTGENPFACKLCQHKFTTKSQLVRHMKTHTGEKPFACKLCKYKCAKYSNLVCHMRNHTGDKPFACELCKYKCARKCSLVEHLRTHTGENPFACKLCQHKFTTESVSETHEDSHWRKALCL